MGILKWLGVILLLAVIIVLSCAPGAAIKQHGQTVLHRLGADSPAVQRWVLDSPKLWHAVLYGLLALGLMVSLPGPIWRGALLALAVAALLETAQVFIPSRQAGLGDFLFSGLGVALATLTRTFHEIFSIQ